jgi:hypothetical protein
MFGRIAEAVIVSKIRQYLRKLKEHALRPKQPFIALWMIGMFIYGLGTNFVGSLHNLATREYEKDSFWS